MGAGRAILAITEAESKLLNLARVKRIAVPSTYRVSRYEVISFAKSIGTGSMTIVKRKESPDTWSSLSTHERHPILTLNWVLSVDFYPTFSPNISYDLIFTFNLGYSSTNDIAKRLVGNNGKSVPTSFACFSRYAPF